eukprot:7359513-Prymnesium_polylepis.1
MVGEARLISEFRWSVPFAERISEMPGGEARGRSWVSPLLPGWKDYVVVISSRRSVNLCLSAVPSE